MAREAGTARRKAATVNHGRGDCGPGDGARQPRAVGLLPGRPRTGRTAVPQAASVSGWTMPVVSATVWALLHGCGLSPAVQRGSSAMAHWLLKSEPDDWSWTEQLAKGREGAEWTGIRNFSAQNHLRSMKKGEQAFFYHTGKERAVVGIVKVIAEAHPDSTDSAWRAIDVAAVRPLPTPVGLDQIKANKRLAGMALVRLPRLSVQPVADAEWRIICEMGGLD